MSTIMVVNKWIFAWSLTSSRFIKISNITADFSIIDLKIHVADFVNLQKVT